MTSSSTADAPAAVPTDPLAFRALVYKISLGYRHKAEAVGLDVDDLAAAGLWAIARRSGRYDPSRGPLLNYIARLIRWAIWQALRNGEPWAQLPAGPDGGDFDIAAPDAAEPDLEARETIERLLVRLPYRERDLIRRVYGLAGEPPVTMTQVANSMGISKQRAFQLREAAMRRLRDEAERLGLHGATEAKGLA